MSTKILVVDDSPTVQKVVAITLANEGYELFQALNEDELFNKLKATQFDLVLLDFTISQKKSGYETIKQIQAIAKETPILLLLGQFDQVDEQILSTIGVQEKLIKPFDSGRFIQRCRVLIEKKPLELKVEEKPAPGPELTILKSEENWTLNSPVLELETSKKPDLPKPLKSPGSNLLKAEIESWGIPVPSVIGKKTETVVELPPVIEKEESPVSSLQMSEELPKEEDLAYPSSGDISVSALTQATLSSHMISMSELAPEEDDRGFTDEQTERLDLSHELSTNLEQEIHADSAEDFWMTDIESSEAPQKEKDSSSVVSFSSVDLETNPHPDQAQSVSVSIDKDELIEKVKAQIPTLNEEEILAKLREALPPIVEQYVKDYCEKAVERVVWEVIPDLAENLIRKELRSIAESVPRD